MRDPLSRPFLHLPCIRSHQSYKYARSLIFLCTLSEHPGLHLPRQLLAGFSTRCLTFFITRHPLLLGFKEHSIVHSTLVILDYFEIKHFFFQFRTCSSRVQVMEARPATTQDMHPAPGESIPIARDQVPNDRGQRDRTRDRRGKPCRKRLKVLDNLEKLAFRGWKNVLELWTFEHCKQYIEWCHIMKAFKQDRYLAHRLANKANLKFCKNPDFLERCIQVYQYLFHKERVVRNEVTYKLCRMVWV